MNIFATCFFAGAAVIVGASSAHSADVVDACDTSWAGIYGGVHGGYVTGKGDYGAASPSLDGFMGGVLGGYNFQTCNFVIGIEGDVGFGEIDGASGSATDFDIEPNGHARIRLGLPVDNFMPFIAGGLAYADMDVRDPNPAIGNNSKQHLGFTIGGGLDFKLTDAFIVRGEYLFDGYESKKYDGINTSADTHTFRAAVVYKFN